MSPFVAAFFAAVDPALCVQKRSAICAIDVDGLRGEANRMLREAGCAEIDQIDLTDAPSKENFRRVFFEEESLPLRVTRRQDSRQ